MTHGHDPHAPWWGPRPHGPTLEALGELARTRGRLHTMRMELARTARDVELEALGRAIAAGPTVVPLLPSDARSAPLLDCIGNISGQCERGAGQERKKSALDSARAVQKRRRKKNPYDYRDLKKRHAQRARLARAEERAGHPTAAAALRSCERGSWLASRAGSLVVDFESGRPVRRAMHCHHRGCQWCAAKSAELRHAKFGPVIAERFRAERPVLGTLTQQDVDGESLEDAWTRFSRSLSRLVSSSVWREHVHGALLTIEVTRSTRESRHARAQDLRTRAHGRRGRMEWGRFVSASQDIAEAERLEAEEGERWHVHAHVVIDPKRCDKKRCTACVERSRFDVAASMGREERATLRALTRELDEAQRRAKELGIPPREMDGVRELRAEVDAWALDKSLRRPFIAQEALLEAWRKAKRDEGLSLCDVDGGVNLQRGRVPLQEAIKYPLKGMDMDRLGDGELLEFVRWLRGKRLVRTYGVLRDLEEDLQPSDVPTEEEEPAARAVVCVDTGEVFEPKECVWSPHPRHEREALRLLYGLWEARSQAPPTPE